MGTDENKPRGKVIDDKVLAERRKKRKRRKVIGAAVIAAVLIILAAVLLKVFGVFEKLRPKDPNRTLKAEVIPVEYTPKGKYSVDAAGGCVIFFDDGGVTGIDAEGKWKWNSTCAAADPVLRGDGEVLLVVDHGGLSAWAFGSKGLLWRYISPDPLIGAFVSNGGKRLVTICEQDNFESSVTLLEAEGDKLTEKFTRRFGSYRMFTAACSGDDTQLAASGMYSESGGISGVTVFLRVSDGEAYASKITDGNIYMQLNYLSDGSLIAASSESLLLTRRLPAVSGRDDAEIELWSRMGARQMIIDTASVGGKSVAVAFADDNASESGANSSEIAFYGSDGVRSASLKLSGAVSDLCSYGGTVCACAGRNIYLINASGVLIGTCEFENEVRSIAYLEDRTVACDTGNGVFIVKFSD